MIRYLSLIVESFYLQILLMAIFSYLFMKINSFLDKSNLLVQNSLVFQMELWMRQHKSSTMSLTFTALWKS